VKFANGYCNVPICSASRARILAGMLPIKNRFLEYKTFVEQEMPEAVTLPQLFKNNGYITISNGKIYHHLDDRESDWNELWFWRIKKSHRELSICDLFTKFSA